MKSHGKNGKERSNFSKNRLAMCILALMAIISVYVIVNSGIAASEPVTSTPRPTQKIQPQQTTSAIVTTANNKKKIAYAITVTKDGHFVDGALVLGYAARKVHDATKGFPSEYDVDLVAFVVPSVVEARTILSAYGWRVLERQLPVAIDEIENKEYAQKMKDSGCCGADEFLKLWAYTLTEYHRVVHLDMDSIVFKNMVNTLFHLFALFCHWCVFTTKHAGRVIRH